MIHNRGISHSCQICTGCKWSFQINERGIRIKTISYLTNNHHLCTAGSWFFSGDNSSEMYLLHVFLIIVSLNCSVIITSRLYSCLSYIYANIAMHTLTHSCIPLNTYYIYPKIPMYSFILSTFLFKYIIIGDTWSTYEGKPHRLWMTPPLRKLLLI